ncbi:TPA: SocA family protein, partial [Legionella pneumophila]|nr:SocA family protein [Legionella pneumophila]
MNKESISSYRKIADYIILYFQEHGEPLTNLKLQKLLYYAQGWYLALYNKPLFDDKIEAWVHGPVIPAAYHSFKQYGYGLIDEKPSFPNLSPKIRSHLDEVIDVYGSYSAFELEHLTHQT